MSQDNDDIVTITNSVLSLMLEMDAQTSEPYSADKPRDMVTGCVQISGHWQGAVVLQASVAFATEAASRMLGIQDAEVVENDLLDVLAELTNMIGGNLKSLVPGPSYLSLPFVARGHDFHIAGAKAINDVSMSCMGEPLRVVKCERRAYTA